MTVIEGAPVNLFAAPEPELIERDGYDRPLIIPAPRGKAAPNLKAKRIAYTRMSTFAKALSDGSGLTTWKVRHAAVGIARSPDLAGIVAAFGANPDDLDKPAKAYLDTLCEQAHDRSFGNAKANYGTAIHLLTEPGNDGYVPERMTDDVASYVKALDELGFEAVGTERFVVNDELIAAGTFDHLYRATRNVTVTRKAGADVVIPEGAILVGDKKTGHLNFDEHAIQLGGYAHADDYDPETGVRTPHGASLEWGLLVHIPAGQGKTQIFLVDLAAGWAGCKLAQQVRAYRSAGRSTASSIGIAEVERTVVEPVVEVQALPADADPFAAFNARTAALHAEKAAEVVTVGGIEFERVTPAEGEPFAPDPFNATPPALPVEPEPVDAGPALALLEAKLDAVDVILDGIAKARTRDEVTNVWNAHELAWRDEHTAAAQKRLEQIAA